MKDQIRPTQKGSLFGLLIISNTHKHHSACGYLTQLVINLFAFYKISTA